MLIQIVGKVISSILGGIIKALFLHNPKLAGITGLIISIFFSGLGIHIWYTEKTVPRISIDQTAAFIAAHGKSRVIIEGVTWDCRNVFHYGMSGRNDKAIFTNTSRDIVGVASFSYISISCSDLLENKAIDGFLEKMDDAYYQSLPQKDFDMRYYKNSATRLFLCVCNIPENATSGIILCIIMVIVGLILYPLFSAMKKDIDKKMHR